MQPQGIDFDVIVSTHLSCNNCSMAEYFQEKLTWYWNGHVCWPVKHKGLTFILFYKIMLCENFVCFCFTSVWYTLHLLVSFLILGVIFSLKWHLKQKLKSLQELVKIIIMNKCGSIKHIWQSVCCNRYTL